MIGKRFGRLKVLKLAFKNKHGGLCYTCKCDCGERTTVVGYFLRAGRTVSCGCYQEERLIGVPPKHGMSKTPTYNTWCKIIARCTKPSNGSYCKYGARGITVCKRWSKFENFLEDMGKKPHNMESIDRIDGSKGYSKKNCRWATARDQARNMRSNVHYTFKGKTQCLSAWAEELDLEYFALHHRLKTKRFSQAIKKCKKGFTLLT